MVKEDCSKAEAPQGTMDDEARNDGDVHFLHTCTRLRIVTAHGVTQPVYMLRGVRQGNPESSLLYALLLEPLLRA